MGAGTQAYQGEIGFNNGLLTKYWISSLLEIPPTHFAKVN